MRGTTPPVILSSKRKARAARHRLDVEHDVAVLAVAAGLLLVPAALDDALADGFAVADARLAALDGDAVTVAETLGGDAQVHLALAPQHHLMRLRIVHDGDRRVFLGKLVERLAEFDVVLALLRRDRDGQHRRVGLDLGDSGMGLLARGQRVAGPGLVELGESYGLAERWPVRASRSIWPTSLNTPATRPASSSADKNVVPSPACPASIRAIDIRPPWVVFCVLST